MDLDFLPLGHRLELQRVNFFIQENKGSFEGSFESFEGILKLTI